MSKLQLLQEYISEVVLENAFIRHVKSGLDMYGRNKHQYESNQIVSDWLEHKELNDDNLLSPTHVFRIERFAAEHWPIVLEQFRGNKTMATITMLNILDAKYSELL